MARALVGILHRSVIEMMRSVVLGARLLQTSLERFPEEHAWISGGVRAPYVVILVHPKVRVIYPREHVVIQVPRSREVMSVVILPGCVVRHDGHATSPPAALTRGRTRTSRWGIAWGTAISLGMRTDYAPVVVHLLPVPARAGQTVGTCSEAVREPERRRSVVLVWRSSATARLGDGVARTAHVRGNHASPAFPASAEAPVVLTDELQYSRSGIPHC